MSYSFDQEISRRGTSCYKWDWDEKITGHKNLLPFWVADMDFAVAPVVQEALSARIKQPVFGYTFRPEALDDALIQWFKERHRWDIDRNHLFEVPGIVPTLHMFVREFTRPGDTVILQEPVYYPCRHAIENNGRHVAVNALKRNEEKYWQMDFDDLIRVIEATQAKMLILCSPHNPVGRVWSEQELVRLAKICRSYHLTVISDEIHADLIHSGYRHHPWLSLPQDLLPPSISLVSPSKTFNLPGLNSAYAVSLDEELREGLSSLLCKHGMSKGNSALLAYTAAEAAWSGGADWLDALLVYLAKNDQILRETLKNSIPESYISPLEGGYLEWIDLAYTGLDNKKMEELLWENGVWLSSGVQFGLGGQGHMRMNIACPRAQLEKGLSLMQKAFS